MSPMRDPEPVSQRPRGVPLSIVWVSAGFALPLAIVLATPLWTVDLAYVVRAGQVTLRTGELLRSDVFLFTARCDPWLNQQWGSQIVLAAVFDGAGWLGLALARAALVLGILAFTYGACRAYGATRRSAAWLTLLATVLLLGGLHLRAQLFGLLFFGAIRWIAASRGRRPGLLFWAIPLHVLWANVHGSFPLGIVVLLLAWAEDRGASPRSDRALVVAGLSLGATFLNPFGPSVWTYVAELSTHPVIREVVQEWRPPWFTTYTGVVFYASVALAIVVFTRNRRAVRWSTWLEIAVFAALAASSSRAVFWWSIVLPVAIARLPWAGRSSTPDPRNRVNVVLAAVMAAVPLFALVRWLPHTGSAPPGELLSFAPARLTTELRTILEPGEPFANPQSWGSWFELSVPGHPLFVDSRFEVMPIATLRANGRIAKAEPGWEQDLERLPVRVLVVDRAIQPALVEALASDAAWRQVYADDEGLIFVREGRPPAEPLPSCEG